MLMKFYTTYKDITKFGDKIGMIKLMNINQKTNMKLDKKSWVIIFLGICVIISFMMNQKNKNIDGSDIKSLHDSNSVLNKTNDSLKRVVGLLNNKIDSTMVLINENAIELKESKEKIERFKNEKIKIINLTRNMSPNDMSNAFTVYLDKRKGDGGSR